MKYPESLSCFDTEYSACSVSTNPNDRTLFACGLYQVVNQENEDAQEARITARKGRVLLNRLNDDGQMCAFLLFSCFVPF